MPDDTNHGIWPTTSNTVPGDAADRFGSASFSVAPAKPTDDAYVPSSGEPDEAEIDRCAREFIATGSCFSKTLLTAAAMRRFQQRVDELRAAEA